MRWSFLHFERAWEFDASPDEFWAAISRTSEFTDWWSWLRRLDVPGLHEGVVADCAIRPYLPYVVAFQVHVLRAEPGRLVRARITGDLRGDASVELAPSGTGTEVRMSWDLDVARKSLAVIMNVIGPLVVIGHERVVDQGLESFRRRALAPAAGTAPLGDRAP